MKRFKLNISNEETGEDTTPVEEPTEPVVEGEETEPTEPDNTEETPTEPVADDSVSGRIRARQEERARYRARQATDEDANPEDTSNVDAAIAAAAAKVNPSPETVEDAAEKRRYAELVNAETETEGETGSTEEPLISESEQTERTEEAETEVESDEATASDGEVDTDVLDEETTEITKEVDDSIAAVDDVAASTQAVESFLAMAQDSLHGNGISPLAASIGTRMVNQLCSKAGLEEFSTTGISQESFSDDRRSATESFIQKTGDVVKRIINKIIAWFQDLWSWILKFYNSFRKGADKTTEELKKLDAYWRASKSKFKGSSDVINIAVVSQLQFTVTSNNSRSADVVNATATTLDGIFKDLNAASGNSLAKWSQQVAAGAANGFTFSSISSLIPRCMRSNVTASHEWDTFVSPELAGNAVLVAVVPSRVNATELTKELMADVSLSLEYLGASDVQQLSVSRDTNTIEKLFNACNSIQNSVKAAKVALKRQELDMATLNKSIEHLSKEIDNRDESDDAKANSRRALSNLSMQIMLSQKLFNSPVMKLSTYALKVQRATMMLTKKVINHADSVL